MYVARQEAAVRSQGIPVPHLLQNRGVPPNVHNWLSRMLDTSMGMETQGSSSPLRSKPQQRRPAPHASDKLEQRLGSPCLSNSMAVLSVKYVVAAGSAEERIVAMRSIAVSSLLIISPHPSAQPGRVLFLARQTAELDFAAAGACAPVYRPGVSFRLLIQNLMPA